MRSFDHGSYVSASWAWELKSGSRSFGGALALLFLRTLTGERGIVGEFGERCCFRAGKMLRSPFAQDGKAKKHGGFAAILLHRMGLQSPSFVAIHPCWSTVPFA